MPWFKVDDKLHDHRKARTAGTAAMGLWVLSGAWSMDNLTDGFVPDSVCQRWDRNYRRLAHKLVDAGLWMEDLQGGEKGWSFHDWKGIQRSKAEVEQDRHAATERQRKAREAARSRRDNAVTHAETPVLVTVPQTRPDQTSKELAAPPRARDELFDALAEACRINPAELTKASRGSLNGALAQLRLVGATPNQVKVRANRYRQRYPEIALTPPSLAKHWPSLDGTTGASPSKPAWEA